MIWEYGRVIRVEIDFANDGTWVDVSQYVKSFKLHRYLTTQGKDSLDGLTITLRSRNRLFDPFNFQDIYDPANKKFNGPDQGDGFGNIRRGRPIRVWCDIVNTPSGTITSQIFTGKIEEWEFDRDSETATVEAKDLGVVLTDELSNDLGWLRKYVSRQTDLGDDLVHLIANQAGIQVDSIDFLYQIPVFEIKEGETLWAALCRLAEAVCGFMHADGSGKLVFRSYLSDAANNYDYEGEVLIREDILLENPEISYTKPIAKIQIKGRDYRVGNYERLLFKAGQPIRIPVGGLAPGGEKTEETTNTISYTLSYQATEIISIYLDNVPSATGSTQNDVRADDCAILEADGYTVTFQEPYISYDWWPDATKKITYKLAEPRIQFFEATYESAYGDLTRLVIEFSDTSLNPIASYDLQASEIESQSFVDLWEPTTTGVKCRFKNVWDQEVIITKFEIYGYPIEDAGELKMTRPSPYSGTGETLTLDNPLICSNELAEAVLNYMGWKFKPRQQIRIKTWMIPWLLPGVLLDLNLSNEIQGTYQVIELTHEGEGGRQPTSEILLAKFDPPSVTLGTEAVKTESKRVSSLADDSFDFSKIKEKATKQLLVEAPALYHWYPHDTSDLTLEADGLYHFPFEEDIDAGILYYRVLSGTTAGKTGRITGYYNDADPANCYLILEGPGLDDNAQIEIAKRSLPGGGLTGSIDLGKAPAKGTNVEIDATGIKAGTEVVLNDQRTPGIWTSSFERLQVGTTQTWDFWLKDCLSVRKAWLKAYLPANATVRYGATALGGAGEYQLSIDPTALEDFIVEFVTTTENFVGDGTTTIFNLANSPVQEGSVTVMLDGVPLTEGADYTVDYEAGIVSFASAPGSGAAIQIDYIYKGDIRLEVAVLGIFNWEVS